MASASSVSLMNQEVDLDQLPKQQFWENNYLYKWKGFWLFPNMIKSVLDIQSHFKACSDDIILASFPKTGTTWLKALCVSILECQSKGDDDNGGDQKDDLSKKNPHSCVLTFESEVYGRDDSINPEDILSGMPSPRLLHTHLPYTHLPDSMKKSNCKIVYITRNPKDTLVSFWHFAAKLSAGSNRGPYPFEKAYNEFCKGGYPLGPHSDHVLEYWYEKSKRPENILFLKYEELKKDPKEQVKKLASFIGRPLKEIEVEEVLWKSSLDRLKDLEVNKHGAVLTSNIPNNSFFRKGVVGDWKNHFTEEMKKNLDEITRTKLEGSGFDFDV
ncbi:hypothetical protein LWI28_004518 [Acer negundo]|uniref:Sulfotransferase n=1 Tax=Acer negundo TaxID=4023 RepID=A0AAD5I930_ACENE|nr:hypothetical protein LWI28_004518 [Acer negundo]KAK4836407.1 hypothetical protein QYF36_022576 [Acer negundo]